MLFDFDLGLRGLLPVSFLMVMFFFFFFGPVCDASAATLRNPRAERVAETPPISTTIEECDACANSRYLPFKHDS